MRHQAWKQMQNFGLQLLLAAARCFLCIQHSGYLHLPKLQYKDIKNKKVWTVAMCLDNEFLAITINTLSNKVHSIVHGTVYLQLSKWNICIVLLCDHFARHQWQSTVHQTLVLQHNNRPQTFLLCHTNFKCWVKSRLITPVPWFNIFPWKNKICQWLNISTNKHWKSLVI